MKCVLYFVILIHLALASCKPNNKSNDKTQSTLETRAKAFRSNIKNTVELEIFDQYARKFRKGKGTMLTGNIMVAPLDLVQGSYSVKSRFLGKSIEPMSGGYYNYSFKSNLVLLNITGGKQSFTPHALKCDGKPYYALALKDGKIKSIPIELGQAFENDSVRVYPPSKKMAPGTSLFNKEHKLVGMFNAIKMDGKDSIIIIPIEEILQLHPQKEAKRKSISNLRLKTGKIYPKSAEVLGFNVSTTVGKFSFKIYTDLVEYENNMIKLVSDQYYDSLLIHRVIHNFLIQTGAADTKYAEKGDAVGWQGPGYMLPTIIKNKYIHKRSAVAMSKPPDYKNPDNLTSGSQFYIISGRTFNDQELNDYEALKGFKYTPLQRNVYKTVGGAAYLDNDYAVIGEITSGMNVVDKIAGMPVNKDERPLADIRILKMNLILK